MSAVKPPQLPLEHAETVGLWLDWMALKKDAEMVKASDRTEKAILAGASAAYANAARVLRGATVVPGPKS